MLLLLDFHLILLQDQLDAVVFLPLAVPAGSARRKEDAAMRHHFTKSERLALSVPVTLKMECSDMDSSRIQKGEWVPSLEYSNSRERTVSRVITFTIVDYVNLRKLRVSLEGREILTAGLDKAVVKWRIAKIEVGYNKDGRIKWYKSSPSKTDLISKTDPIYQLMKRRVGAVISTDA